MEHSKYRQEVAYFMRRLYRQKLTTTSGGNVSMRLENDIFITSSQTDKAHIKECQVGVISMEGINLTENLKISMEYRMHIAIYTKRPDVKAIVHAHPIFATSFAIAGREIKTNLAGESRAVLGNPVVANYALMGTQELADEVAEASTRGNVILMKNHGVITVGQNLLQAYDRMEIAEAAAKMTFLTAILGGGKELTENELNAIDKLFNHQ